MDYSNVYDAKLERFGMPHFPRIVEALNMIYWTQGFDSSRVSEIVKSISKNELELRRSQDSVQTSDGYSWPLGLFYSLRYSSLGDDSVILFPGAQAGGLFVNDSRSIATYINSNLKGNRMFVVQNALGELLIEFVVQFTKSICISHES